MSNSGGWSGRRSRNRFRAGGWPGWARRLGFRLLMLALVAPAVLAQATSSSPVDTLIDVRTLLNQAERGDPHAAFLLGARFASGRGGVRDDSEAMRWFRAAANRGLAEAQYNLGIMYASGRGVERDMAEAVRWYRLAAEQEVAEAQFNLGTLLRYWIGGWP